MAQALPIPAGQPLDATRKAAGQVVTLACAEAVAVQAAASLTLAALAWPLIPAARAMAGLASALGQPLPLRPLPEQQAVAVTPGSGGAGRAATVPGGAPGAVRAAGAITLGVEEEFVLLDPATGATVLAGPELVRMLGGEPGIQQELMRFQVETGTPVCTSLDDLGRELIRLRRLAAAAAASLGCRLVASGVAPYRTPGLAAVTPQPRYRELARRYAPVVAEAGTCGCHGHVGVPSREAGAGQPACPVHRCAAPSACRRRGRRAHRQGRRPAQSSSKSWRVNRGWVVAANIAADLQAWCRLLGLHDQDGLSDAEPDTLRYRLWHIPARLVRHARRRTLKISRDWPWKNAFLACSLAAHLRHARTIMNSTNHPSDAEGGHPGAVGAGARPSTPGQSRTPSSRRETDMRIKNRRQHNQ